MFSLIKKITLSFIVMLFLSPSFVLAGYSSHALADYLPIENSIGHMAVYKISSSPVHYPPDFGWLEKNFYYNIDVSQELEGPNFDKLYNEVSSIKIGNPNVVRCVSKGKWQWAVVFYYRDATKPLVILANDSGVCLRFDERNFYLDGSLATMLSRKFGFLER